MKRKASKIISVSRELEREFKKRKLQKQVVLKSKIIDHMEQERDLEGTKLIGGIHALIKYISQAKNDITLKEGEREAKIKGYENEIEKLGGLEAYHSASLKGETNQVTKSFNASKWVLKEVKGILSKGDKRKIKLLDVGALINHYQSIPWINSEAINLTPIHESVKQGDLLEYNDKYKVFDVVVLSLVVNFEGDPKCRGEMLKIASQLLIEDADLGLFFLALPKACLENSRYLKHSLLIEMCSACHLSLFSHTTSDLLSLYVFKKNSSIVPKTLSFPRVLCRGGKERNNFCIILNGPNEKNAKDEKLNKKNDNRKK